MESTTFLWSRSYALDTAVRFIMRNGENSRIKSVVLILQRAFANTLPLILIGAFTLTLRDFPVQGFQALLERLLGSTWHQAADNIISGTLGLASLAILGTLSAAMAKQANMQRNGPFIPPQLAAVVSLASVFTLVSPTDSDALQTMFALDSGLLPTMLLTVPVCAFFIRLTRIPRLQAPVATAGYDPVIRDTLKVMPACLVAICTCALLRIALLHADIDDHALHMARTVFPALFPQGDGITFGIVYSAISQLFWFFGLHGPNMLFSVEAARLTPADLANAQAVADNLHPVFIQTKTFFDVFTRMGGSGSTLCLIIAMGLHGKKRCQSKLCLLAALPALFNVNEPLLLGIPLILNPTYFIPFLLTPIVQTLATYVATALDIIPHTTATIPWTTPVLISGYLATGSIHGVLMQIFNLTLGTVLYFPFVSLSSALHERSGRRSMKTLLDAATRCTVDVDSSKCLDITGEEGQFAKALAEDLGTALKGGTQLFMVYQPQYDVQVKRLVGVEALLRWNHPVYGYIPPPIAVALAEDTGMMATLGELILHESCAHRAAWCNVMDNDVRISVNVSPRQLHDARFPQVVQKVLSETGIPPDQLELEVSESSMVEPTPTMTEALKTLSQRGISIAIDDFGMGQASLRYMRAFQVDTVKIDRSLTEADSREVNDNIVRSIVDLGNAMHITTIVEGVEHNHQLRRFEQLGCTVYQGFLFSRPVLAEELLQLLRRHHKSGWEFDS